VAILRLGAPIAVAPGDRLVLRRSSGSDRIVGAMVIDGSPARGVSRRRQTADRVGRLAMAVAAGDGAATAAARLDLHGVLEVAGDDGGRAAAAPDVVLAVTTAVLAAVDGVASLDDIRKIAAHTLRREATVTRSTALDLGNRLVAAIVRDGRLVREGATVRLPSSQPVSPTPAPDPQLEAAMDRLEQVLSVPAPPPLAAAAHAVGCPVAGIRELERRGRIVELEPDLAYAAGTYAELTDRAVTMAATAPLTPAAFRDATGTSRKYVMAILADLDRRGVLRRVPDGHVPGPRPVSAAAVHS
jgi:hypothetical protein